MRAGFYSAESMPTGESDRSTAVESQSLDDALVTVVIPARDEEDFIGPCLDSILAQTERNLQVLVVDGRSMDRTREIVQEYRNRDARIELLANPAGIVPTALNIALKAARGAWLVRVDAHSTVPPDYVARAVRHLRTGRWGGVGGRKDAIGVTAAGRAIAAAMGSRFGVGGSVYHYGTHARVVDHVPFGAYPTALARQLGGWDERFTVNQDFEFDRRVREQGHALLFDPDLRIDWHCRQSIRAFFAQYHRYGYGKVAVMRAHPRSIRPRHLAPPALVVAAAVALALAPWWPWLILLVAASYAVVLAAASVATASQLPDGTSRVLVPAAFLAMHTGWGLGFWRYVARMLAGSPPAWGTKRVRRTEPRSVASGPSRAGEE